MERITHRYDCHDIMDMYGIFLDILLLGVPDAARGPGQAKLKDDGGVD
jgi:hypothetical protein